MLDEFFFSELAAMTDEEFNFLVAHQDVLFGVPTYDPLYFGTADDPDYALTLHSRQLQNTFRDVKKFWTGVKSDDIQLMAMHADVLLDADRIEDTLLLMQVSGALSPPLDTATPAQLRAEAVTVATFLQENVAEGREFYNNPLWTLNAYAFSAEGDPDPAVQGLPDKLVFGDGLLTHRTPSASATSARESSWATSSPTTSSSSSASSTPARPTRPRPRAGPS